VTQVHPRRLRIDEQWRLCLYDPGGVPAGYYGVPLDGFPAGKWITHTPRIRGGYPQCEGLGRVAVWYVCFSKWTVRDWLALAETQGRGIRLGKWSSGTDPKHPARATPEDVDALDDALESLSTSIWATFPDSTEVELHDPVSGETAHKGLVDWCSSELSKLVLGETLTTEAGVRGARSLGEVHADVSRMLAASDARAIEQTVRRCLLAPLIEFNFGREYDVRLAFNVDPPANLDGEADRLAKLVPLGFKVRQEDVADRFGWPSPAEGEEILSGKVPGEPEEEEPPMKPEQQAPAEPPEEDGPVDKDEPEGGE
jgi:phage gp29-like protein